MSTVFAIAVVCCFIMQVCEAYPMPKRTKNEGNKGKETEKNKKNNRNQRTSEEAEGMHNHLIICFIQEVIAPAVQPYFHVNAYTHVQTYA